MKNCTIKKNKKNTLGNCYSKEKVITFQPDYN